MVWHFGSTMNVLSWDDSQHQLRYNSSWKWTQRCWFSFNPAKVCTIEKRAHDGRVCLGSHNWQVKAESSDCSQLLNHRHYFLNWYAYLSHIDNSGLSLRRCVPALGPDKILLSFSSIVRRNYSHVCNLWRVIVLGDQKYQHDDSLTIHLISMLSSPKYGKMRPIDGWFADFLPKIGYFISVWMFRGGQRQI